MGGTKFINLKNRVAITPGLTATEITIRSIGEWQEQATPFGCVGVPEEIARVAVSLVSDYADFTTGENIDADGGFVDELIIDWR